MAAAMRVGAGVALLLGSGLLLAACSGEKAKTPAAPAAAPVAAAPATPPPEAPAARPAEADAVDAALKAAEDFDAKVATELAGIGKAQQRIHDLAARALELAGKGGEAGRVTAARSEADKTHAALAAGLTRLQAGSAETAALVDAALAQCAMVPALADYEGCVALTTEQATMTLNTEALTQRYAAAETAWPADRARLDEASATLALGR
jgi:hypothetical protein